MSSSEQPPRISQTSPETPEKEPLLPGDELLPISPDVVEIVAYEVSPKGSVDYSENDENKEFSPVIPFSYARIAHPHHAGEVLPATSFTKGTWRAKRTVSHHDEIMSPATPAKTEERLEDFEYKPRLLEGKVMAARVAIGGLVGRLRGKDTSHSQDHEADKHHLNINQETYSGFFDESSLLGLNEKIEQRAAQLQQKAREEKHTNSLSAGESNRLANVAQQRVLDEYVGTVKTNNQEAFKTRDREELKQHINLARRMITERLEVAEQHEREGAERAQRAAKLQAAQRLGKKGRATK